MSDDETQNIISIDPNNPEKSIADNMARNAQQISLIQADDGRVLAFRYAGQDDTMWSQIMYVQSYAMVRPVAPQDEETPGDPPCAVFDIVDYYVSEKVANENPERLEEFKAQGFEMTGTIDNHYSDIFGLVWPDDLVGFEPPRNLKTGQTMVARRAINGKHFITEAQAHEAEHAWLANPVPTLAESKEPMLNKLYDMQRRLETLKARDWEADRLQAEKEQELVRKFNEKIQHQKPFLN